MSAVWSKYCATWMSYSRFKVHTSMIVATISNKLVPDLFLLPQTEIPWITCAAFSFSQFWFGPLPLSFWSFCQKVDVFKCEVSLGTLSWKKPKLNWQGKTKSNLWSLVLQVPLPMEAIHSCDHLQQPFHVTHHTWKAVTSTSCKCVSGSCVQVLWEVTRHPFL